MEYTTLQIEAINHFLDEGLPCNCADPLIPASSMENTFETLRDTGVDLSQHIDLIGTPAAKVELIADAVQGGVDIRLIDAFIDPGMSNRDIARSLEFAENGNVAAMPVIKELQGEPIIVQDCAIFYDVNLKTDLPDYPDYSNKQLGIIVEAIGDGVPFERMEPLLAPNFPTDRLEQMVEYAKNGEWNKAEICADMRIEPRAVLNCMLDRGIDMRVELRDYQEYSPRQLQAIITTFIPNGVDMKFTDSRFSPDVLRAIGKADTNEQREKIIGSVEQTAFREQAPDFARPNQNVALPDDVRNAVDHDGTRGALDVSPSSYGWDYGEKGTEEQQIDNLMKEIFGEDETDRLDSEAKEYTGMFYDWSSGDKGFDRDGAEDAAKRDFEQDFNEEDDDEGYNGVDYDSYYD